MVGKIHITIPTFKLKRFLREYIVAVCGTVLFLILLVILIVSRYYSLTGLDNLSKLNPLITTQNDQLIARDKAYGAVASQGGGENTNSTADTSQKTSQPQPTSGSTSQNNTSTPGQSSQPATSGGGTTPAPQFAISIGTITQTSSAPTGRLQGLNPVCTITHQFTADVGATHGPGTMTYTWVQSDGTISAVQKQDFVAGASTEQVTYQWKITSYSNDFWVKLTASSPSQTEKVLNFRHQCIL